MVRPDSDDTPGEAEIAQWLEEARAGSRSALGRLLEKCRPYLLAIANENLDADLQAKLGGSDLVQETCFEAQRDFQQFEGKTQDEWFAWLRRLLLNNVANTVRYYRATGKRKLGRERPLGHAPEVDAAAETPSALARQGEATEALRLAVQQLPIHYRDVIHWRNYERLTFEEIGARLGKSAEAARKLWGRAIEQLYQLLRAQDESD